MVTIIIFTIKAGTKGINHSSLSHNNRFTNDLNVSSWDEWVREERLLKYNEENLKMKDELFKNRFVVKSLGYRFHKRASNLIYVYSTVKRWRRLPRIGEPASVRLVIRTRIIPDRTRPNLVSISPRKCLKILFCQRNLRIIFLLIGGESVRTSVSTKLNREDANDEDLIFFYSLLPQMKKLDSQQKTLFYMKVHRYLYELMRGCREFYHPNELQ